MDNNKKIKKIAVVGACIGDSASGHTPYYLNLLYQLAESKSYEISCFSNFSSIEYTTKSESNFQNYHLHQLPEVFSRSNFYSILYVINNSFDSYLYNWFRDSYPGLVLLEDASLFNLELGPLMHATDPIGLDGKFASHYPNSKVSIGKDHVLGRSLEIYSSLFPMLESIDSEYGALVLENRLLEFLAKHNVKATCVPISNYITTTSELSTKALKSSNAILFISYNPFSLLSRELRTLAGYESYRAVPVPAYYIVEYSGDAIISIDEVPKDSLLTDVPENIGGLVLTDIQPSQGVPVLIYQAMELGMNISLPVVLKEEFDKFGDISYHSRNASLIEISRSLLSHRKSNVYSLSEGFIHALIATLENFSMKISQLNIGKTGGRRDKLNSNFEQFINKWSEASSVLGLSDTSLDNLKLNLEELFVYEKA
jgi:hypothetical protein